MHLIKFTYLGCHLFVLKQFVCTLTHICLQYRFLLPGLQYFFSQSKIVYSYNLTGNVQQKIVRIVAENKSVT